MTIVSINEFSGMDLISTPAKRSPSAAILCRNVSFRGGRLLPLGFGQRPTDSNAKGIIRPNTRWLYRLKKGDDWYWMSWGNTGVPVNMVQGIVPNDRFGRAWYTGAGPTGDREPRMTSGEDAIGDGTKPAPVTDYPLGVPAPSGTILVNVSGTANPDSEPKTSAYVYTNVTKFGEEGPPSAPTKATASPGQNIEVVLPADTYTNPAFSNGSGAVRRIYRSSVGSIGAEYRFLREHPVNNNIGLSITDDIEDFSLGEPLPSLSWTPPPSELRGLVALPGGILAGYLEDTLWFSEPHLPHAWPLEYRISLEDKIQALAVGAAGLLVFTENRPYVVSGAVPESFAATRMEFVRSCSNKRSVVVIDGTAFWCSPDGIAASQGVETILVTEKILRSEHWHEFVDYENVLCFQWQGLYIAVLDANNLPASDSKKTGFAFDPVSGSFSLLEKNRQYSAGYFDPSDGSLRVLSLS